MVLVGKPVGRRLLSLGPRLVMGGERLVNFMHQLPYQWGKCSHYSLFSSFGRPHSKSIHSLKEKSLISLFSYTIK